ncbi:MAG: bifunctional methylenetetrahydrofolate dehydrogenase/methenyltetrahydrofolate cyclohydrolase FolD [Leptospirales bacterium]|nr:bifunctional methylenetetrahydrofolate dehydrogenase/methenyltetrahydrofolate cyclohydrolase FolD [Leptospirales bacterium]
MAEIIDGKKIADDIRAEIKAEAAALKEKHRLVPGLAVVLVGNDPASETYVRMKKKACAETGIESFEFLYPADTPQQELLELIDSLNARDEINGILVQLPLPRHIDENSVILRISPEKDVDGFHPANVGRIVIGDDGAFYPCTPYGIQEMIVRTLPDLKGKHLVVVGRSNIVGKPVANMMLQKNSRADCIVTVCHTAAADIGYFTSQADILVVAAGRPMTITPDMVKDGAVVIDVGTNHIPHPDDPGKTKLVGDVDFEGVSKKASAISPVPGGVGPMTITMLLRNTLKACKTRHGIKG